MSVNPRRVKGVPGQSVMILSRVENVYPERLPHKLLNDPLNGKSEDAKQVEIKKSFGCVRHNIIQGRKITVKVKS
jgi:hypothetical protein